VVVYRSFVAFYTNSFKNIWGLQIKVLILPMNSKIHSYGKYLFKKRKITNIAR